MQAVIDLTNADGSYMLDTCICGVPLLSRVIFTALRAGCTDILVVVSSNSAKEIIRRHLEGRHLPAEQIYTLAIPELDRSNDSEFWQVVSPGLEDRFVWLPANFLPHKATLAELLSEADRHPEQCVVLRRPGTPGPGGPCLGRPAVFYKSAILSGMNAPVRLLTLPDAAGIRVTRAQDAARAEVELIRRSGKVTDGIYSRFNRALCRPAVRWLSHTPVTPNAVTYVGLAVAVLAGLCFAKGTWAFDVAGGALFFLSGLFDEVDGMLARVRFQESTFGCWLETAVDYATYLLIFAGMTIGSYHRYGPEFLAIGLALLIGCVLAFITISIQRRLAAPPSRPNEYAQRYLRALEQDSANLISRAIRTLQFLLRKGVLVHYVLLFAVLGLVPLVMVLSALGANIAWMVTIYFNVRLFRSPAGSRVARGEVAGAGVRK